MTDILTFVFFIILYLVAMMVFYRIIRRQCKYHIEKEIISRWDDVFNAYLSARILDYEGVFRYKKRMESDYVKCHIILSYSNIIFWFGIVWMLIIVFAVVICGIVMMHNGYAWSWDSFDKYGAIVDGVSIFTLTPFVLFMVLSSRKIEETVQFGKWPRESVKNYPRIHKDITFENVCHIDPKSL